MSTCQSIPYSPKFLRGKHFAGWPNSAQKIFMDKIFVFKLPATPMCYELEISREGIFTAMLKPTKSAKIFNLKNFRLAIHSQLL